MRDKNLDNEMITVGWREWVSLPTLGLNNIKAKMDTGAKTSCLHAFIIEPFSHNGQDWVRFGMHPIQYNTKTEIFCQAPVSDQREVTDSGGHKELRFVITTDFIMAGQQWPIEITLTNRDTMQFRMLLGRSAMHERIIVDPSLSFALGEPNN